MMFTTTFKGLSELILKFYFYKILTNFSQTDVLGSNFALGKRSFKIFDCFLKAQPKSRIPDSISAKWNAYYQRSCLAY